METPPASSNRAMAELTTTVRRNTQIAFDDGDDYRRTRDNDLRSSFDQSRRRSASRDSIRSARSRSRQPEATLPIGFRTLSFQVSASKGRSDYAEKPDKSGTTKVGDKRTTDFESADDHTITLEALYQRLRTSPQQGLSQDAAARRLTENGLNVLPKRRTNYAKKLLGYVFGGFCSILWVGVIIFFICWRPLGDPDPQAYNLGLAILVIIVIILQASFSAFQDWSTAKTMNSILDMLPSDALVMRQGEWTTVRTSNIAPGDVVRIRVGDKVPADLRLTTTSGDVRFDRSAMTGESEECSGSVDTTDENFLETHNIALMGTLVTNGSATGVVVFTGARTVMGGIAMATTDVKERPTSIQREISRFVRIIVCLTACLACLILFSWAGWLRIKKPEYMNVVAMLNNVMGCVVAFIPEGMPVGVALTLMMIARRMKKADVLPKSLATVEMLGCVQVICSDKTGTLTKNQMSVTTVGFLDRKMTVEESQRGEKDASAIAMTEMYRAAHLCNEATFDPLSLAKPIEERLTQGNPTDGAVLRFAESGVVGSSIRDAYPQLAQVPFNSKNKFAMTLHEDRSAGSGSAGGLLIVKGAPDVLLPHCSHYRSYEGVVRPLDEAAKQRFSELQSSLSRNAERVLMFCQRSYAVGPDAKQAGFEKKLVDEGMADLVIIGVVGIFDPPRPEATKTVAACRRAGIRFHMMTGDFGLTGAAIARQIGIFTGEREPDTYATITSLRRRSEDDVSEKDFDPRSPPTSTNQSLLLEGTQISKLEDQDWDLVCSYEEIVFGRCSPENKLRIVTELQKRGMSTAVTGDGVNDAPAMKAADVGVAMVNGSDVALEAADLVLLDGFDSIVDGIRLGRLVFQNLQKVISYLLPAGSWSEIWPVLLNVFLGVPLPLSSFLMIIICVFTDLFLSLSLIMEKEEFDLLSQPPRNPKKDHLINLKIYAQSYLFVGVMETVCAHGMYFLYYWRHARIPASDLFLAFERYTDGFHGYSQAELTAFNTTGQGVYFVTLVILQLGNILSIRNKRMSILQADPIRKERRNPWLLLSAVISISIAVFVTEEPGLQKLFGTANVPIEFWVLPIPLALGILVMDEMRKLAVRTWPRGFLARIAW
ncbi:hypothetical protein LTR56_006372 [Elasticomyces elasticus]|nr:hypothetical protein LTR56_006372 [Elasticomyces elasticus]KAK3663417.1 hypothetical protein LTR22_005827 [Elasticomyces elasticus]KAK4925496.1 hypothetical protein LTR49_007563 [Elasticomyces elasticus]KAK5764591.1 hypothetical protein LTS12_005324 [Elasticomyces elasticus]